MKSNAKKVCFTALATLTVAALCIAPASAQQAPKVISNAVANQPVHFDVSRPLSELAMETPSAQGIHQTHAPLRTKPLLFNGALHSQAAPAAISAPTPNIRATVGLGFEGVNQIGDSMACPPLSGFFLVPPDTNAAVGDRQVVQWVNVCYAVFDKRSGAVVAGPFAGTNFWKGFGGPCEANNDGDIIIQFDKANHRWLAAQNVFSGPPYYTCVAVSQTSDASGSYYRYQFPQAAGFPDYPKWGLQSNTYYQSQNVFGTTSFLGVNVCAYQANLMRHGNPNAQQVCILDNSNGTLFDDSMLPADDDTPSGYARGESIGNFLPAGDDEASDAEVYLGSIDNFLPGDTHVYEYVFSVNFRKPANSTLAGVDGSMPISVPAFDLAFCASGGFLTTDCVPQPSAGSDMLDTLGDRLMYRLAHFSSYGTQHYLVAHSVNNTSAVATTWYEFRAKGEDTTKLSLHQSGITPDDGEYRWMGSVAMNRAGDIAVGYSRSSAAAGDYPSIYYSGQTAGDPLGTTETEAVIKQGGGSQMNSFDRWGDYSSMALDGSNSCTFWYTNEFYPVDGSFAWNTWVASLNFHNCRFEN